jgi:membrane-associated phospholipid phosphatase
MEILAWKHLTGTAVARTALFLVLSMLAPGLRAQDAQGQDEGRPIGWKRVIPTIASDQKQIWTFPIRAVRGSHWAPVLGVMGVTAAAIAADPHSMPYFRRTNSFHGFNSVFTGQATHLGMIVAPATLYAVGLIRKDSYQQKTALLAGVAVADTAILTVVMKGVTSRLRPVEIPVSGDFDHTWFKSKGSRLRGRGSFPSGHTIAAFSVATVVSRRYPHHRWIPYVAYGLASVVGFSRVTLSSHFPSDVFLGAALGYSISRYSVLR